MAAEGSPACADPRSARLARARGVLREAEHRAGVRQEVALRPGDFTRAEEGGACDLGVPLTRGSLIGVAGSTALLLAMVGAAAAGEGWVAVVGMPSLGVAAAAEFGVDLDRLVLIPRPGTHAAGAIAALIDGFDVVVVGGEVRLEAGQRRSLLGRARNQRTTLFTPLWPEIPIKVEAGPASWSGLGQGRGYLRENRIAVRRSGQGAERRMYVSLRGGRIHAGEEALRSVG